MKAMILSAGLGTRLRPLTDRIPKALLPVAGKTLIEWQIEKLLNAGIKDIVINVHHKAEQIITYLLQKRIYGCCISFSDEPNGPYETGGGLRHARQFLDTQDNEPILVCNVDILNTIQIADLQKAYHNDMLALLVVSQRPTQRYLLVDNNAHLQGWTNIATNEYRPANLIKQPETLTWQRLAFSGMQVLSPRIFEKMDKVVAEKGERFSLIDLYLSLCQQETIYTYQPTDYHMIDVGKIDQLDDAETFAQHYLLH